MCKSISKPIRSANGLKGSGRHHAGTVHRQRRSQLAVKGCRMQFWYCFVYTAHWDATLNLIALLPYTLHLYSVILCSKLKHDCPMCLVIARRCLKFAVHNPPGLADSVFFENPNRERVFCSLLFGRLLYLSDFFVMVHYQSIKYICICFLLRAILLPLSEIKKAFKMLHLTKKMTNLAFTFILFGTCESNSLIMSCAMWNWTFDS